MSAYMIDIKVPFLITMKQELKFKILSVYLTKHYIMEEKFPKPTANFKSWKYETQYTIKCYIREFWNSVSNLTLCRELSHETQYGTLTMRIGNPYKNFHTEKVLLDSVPNIYKASTDPNVYSPVPAPISITVFPLQFSNIVCLVTQTSEIFQIDGWHKITITSY